MAQQGFIQAPVMDWTENAGLYNRLQTLQKDVEFIFGGPLNKESNKAKAIYLMCCLGQRPKNHLLSQNIELTDYKEIFRVLTEWCKPKQSEIVSFTKLRDLRQVWVLKHCSAACMEVQVSIRLWQTTTRHDCVRSELLSQHTNDA